MTKIVKNKADELSNRCSISGIRWLIGTMRMPDGILPNLIIEYCLLPWNNILKYNLMKNKFLKHDEIEAIELKSVVQEKTLKELMNIIRSCTNKAEAKEKISKEFKISKENARKIMRGELYTVLTKNGYRKKCGNSSVNK